MPWRRLGPTLLLAAGTAVLAVLCVRAFQPTETPAVAVPAARPRLAVLVVFDQLRGDYLTRWQDLFGAGGFRRLQTHAAWFRDCHYPYALTVTGAGHASLLTGCTPAVHGIVANDWFERAEGGSVYCVECRRSQRVPPLPAADGGVPGAGKRGDGGVSPDRLLVPTLADSLKEATAGRGRVVSLSLKDRSAILTVGPRADACYWFDVSDGRFVTSTCYRDQPHAWVTAFNGQGRAERWRGREWTRCRPDLDYARYSGPDDGPGEGRGVQVRDRQGNVLAEQGICFPHPFPDGRYYDALYNSPQGNELLLELVKVAVVAEDLGRDDAPDLLSVSFSSNDPIGHTWGSDSQEVLDVTLRTDRLLRELLTFLDQRVGVGNYALVLTADHGVCPLPEAAATHGHAARRIDPKELTQQAGAFLDATFGSGPGSWFEAAPYPWLYLDADTARRRGTTVAAVEAALADWYPRQPGIRAAYTRTGLQTGVPDEDEIGQRVRRSFHPERCGEVYVLQEPYCLFTSAFGRAGTTHGTPYPYDTHVPLLAYGPGFPPGPNDEPAVPQQAAALLAHGLRIPPPARAEYPLPAGVGN
jgi:hypothetical protein